MHHGSCARSMNIESPGTKTKLKVMQLHSWLEWRCFFSKKNIPSIKITFIRSSMKKMLSLALNGYVQVLMRNYKTSKTQNFYFIIESSAQATSIITRKMIWRTSAICLSKQNWVKTFKLKFRNLHNLRGCSLWSSQCVISWIWYLSILMSWWELARKRYTLISWVQFSYSKGCRR